MKNKDFDNIIYDDIESIKPNRSVLDKAIAEMKSMEMADAVTVRVAKKSSFARYASVLACCVIVLALGISMPFLFHKDGGGGESVAGGIVINTGFPIEYAFEPEDNVLSYNSVGKSVTNNVYVIEKTQEILYINEYSSYAKGDVNIKEDLYVEFVGGAIKNLVGYDNLPKSMTIEGVSVSYGVLDMRTDTMFGVTYVSELFFKFNYAERNYFVNVKSSEPITSVEFVENLFAPLQVK